MHACSQYTVCNSIVESIISVCVYFPHHYCQQVGVKSKMWSSTLPSASFKKIFVFLFFHSFDRKHVTCKIWYSNHSSIHTLQVRSALQCCGGGAGGEGGGGGEDAEDAEDKEAQRKVAAGLCSPRAFRGKSDFQEPIVKDCVEGGRRGRLSKKHKMKYFPPRKSILVIMLKNLVASTKEHLLTVPNYTLRILNRHRQEVETKTCDALHCPR